MIFLIEINSRKLVWFFWWNSTQGSYPFYLTCLYFTVFNYLIFSTKLYSTIFIGLLDLRTQQKIKNNILLSYIYTFNPFHSLEFFLMISSITLWRKTFLFTKLISEPQIRNMPMGGGGNQEEDLLWSPLINLIWFNQEGWCTFGDCP